MLVNCLQIGDFSVKENFHLFHTWVASYMYSVQCRNSKYCISHNILVFSFPAFSSINLWNVISILINILYKNVSVNCIQMCRWTVSSCVGELYCQWTVLFPFGRNPSVRRNKNIRWRGMWWLLSLKFHHILKRCF